MCQFCVEHGDGKAWYLEAANYAYDLDADIERRKYVVDFVRDFGTMRRNAERRLPQFQRLPRSLRRLASSELAKRMQPIHYGQPVPIEELSDVLDITTSVVRVPCPCRYHAGNPSDGYCLLITTKPYEALLDEAYADYDVGPDTSKFTRMSKDEALALLRRAEGEGLMHSVWTFHTPFIGAICNCDLASGCMAMTTTVRYGLPTMFKGHSIAEVDPELCDGCRQCAKHCPFAAVEVDRASHKAVVDAERCYGCGVCRASCAQSALALVARDVPAAEPGVVIA